MKDFVLERQRIAMLIGAAIAIVNHAAVVLSLKTTLRFRPPFFVSIR